MWFPAKGTHFFEEKSPFFIGSWGRKGPPLLGGRSPVPSPRQKPDRFFRSLFRLVPKFLFGIVSSVICSKRFRQGKNAGTFSGTYSMQTLYRSVPAEMYDACSMG